MQDECEEQEEQDYCNNHICSEGILESDEEEDREEETYNSAVGINYMSSTFEQHRRWRNIVKMTTRNVAHPRNELESFMLFISEHMVRSIQRYINRKAVDVRRCAMMQYVWMQNFFYNDILACDIWHVDPVVPGVRIGPLYPLHVVRGD